MNSLKDDWHVGQSVWVTYRGKWVPARIMAIGSKLLTILIVDKARPTKRHPTKVRRRRLELEGMDKPEEEAI